MAFVQGYWYPYRFGGYATRVPPTAQPQFAPTLQPYGPVPPPMIAGSRKKKKKASAKKKAPKAKAPAKKRARDQSELIEAIRRKNMGDTAAYLKLFQKHARPAQWGLLGSQDMAGDDADDDSDADYTDDE